MTTATGSQPHTADNYSVRQDGDNDWTILTAMYDGDGQRVPLTVTRVDNLETAMTIARMLMARDQLIRWQVYAKLVDDDSAAVDRGQQGPGFNQVRGYWSARMDELEHWLEQRDQQLLDLPTN